MSKNYSVTFLRTFYNRLLIDSWLVLFVQTETSTDTAELKRKFFEGTRGLTFEEIKTTMIIQVICKLPAWLLRIKALRSFETLETGHSVTQCYIPRDWDPQKHSVRTSKFHLKSVLERISHNSLSLCRIITDQQN